MKVVIKICRSSDSEICYDLNSPSLTFFISAIKQLVNIASMTLNFFLYASLAVSLKSHASSIRSFSKFLFTTLQRLAFQKYSITPNSLSFSDPNNTHRSGSAINRLPKYSTSALDPVNLFVPLTLRRNRLFPHTRRCVVASKKKKKREKDTNDARASFFFFLLRGDI